MLGGLISAALKGAGEGYSTYAKGELENQQKLDYQKQIMEMQEEKDRRIAEFTADLGVKTKKREIEELDPLKRASKVADTREVGAAETEILTDRTGKVGAAETNVLTDRTGKVGAAETDVLTNRETALRPGKIQTAEDTALAQGRAERTNMGAYANDPNARKGARAKAQDQHVESSGSLAQAELARFQLNQVRAIADARTQLANEKDPTKREELSQRIQDLQLGTSTKSYSDVVTAAEGYRKMADNLRRDADKITDNEQERKAMLQRATEYEGQADYILRGAVGKRLPGSAAAKPVESTRSVPTVGKPWERYQTK